MSLAMTQTGRPPMCPTTESVVQKEIESVDVRHRKNLNLAADPVAEVALDPFWGQGLHQPLVRGVVEGEQAHVDHVALVAGAGVGDVLHLHGVTSKTNERTFTFVIEESSVCCAKVSRRNCVRGV